MERHPLHGYLQVAFVGWRYAEPREDLKAAFEAAVREAPEEVEWAFRSVRNWMIVPMGSPHAVWVGLRPGISARLRSVQVLPAKTFTCFGEA